MSISSLEDQLVKYHSTVDPVRVENKTFEATTDIGEKTFCSLLWL